MQISPCFLIFAIFSIPYVVSAQSGNIESHHDKDKSIWTKDNCDALRQHLSEMHARNRFDGTVLIAENGLVKFHASIGYSDMKSKRKIDETASFRLASVSKQFTCMGIMLLKKAGKLDYDDPVKKHIPTFPYENITIRHLMNHTSGLADYMALMHKHWDTGKAIEDRKIAGNKDMVATFSTHKPELLFEPGEKFRYSNSGYVVLGHIIETVSKTPVQQYIKQSILKPLEMDHSHVFRADDRFNPEHRVYGFRRAKNKKGFSPNDFHYLNGMVGDGGIYASALDLLKWDQALYTDKLIPRPMLEEAFSPATLNDGSKSSYGFGWAIDKKGAGKFQVSHSGAWVGFNTYIGRNISEKRTLIYYSHQQ